MWRLCAIYRKACSCSCSCAWRDGAFRYSVSLGHAASSGGRVWGIPQQKSRVRFSFHSFEIWNLKFETHADADVIFSRRSISEDFGIFAEECFRAFGDRVKYWTTLNEPLTFSLYGYDLGLHAPGRCSPGFGNCTAGNSSTEPYIVTHNMLLAHSAAVKIYRTKYQVRLRLCSVLNIIALNIIAVSSWIIQTLENKLQGKQEGSIGIALVVNWMVPYSNSLLDQQATQRAIDFRIGWFVHMFYLPTIKLGLTHGFSQTIKLGVSMIRFWLMESINQLVLTHRSISTRSPHFMFPPIISN